jgi:7,8-dihydropterin-6-yl-methyl-4-(beta-D-ribofuranosyl)aminobenzene 5'-phosphate synthase
MSSAAVTITILVDNKAGKSRTGEELASEHGLSFWIESGDKRILFDTGQGRSLESNAPALGVDLGETDVLVLSHGHYDHTGGVAHVLHEARHADVYCHPEVRRARYAVKDGKAKPIGIPKRPLKALEKLPPERLHWAEGPLMLSDDIGISGPVPRSTSYEDTGGPFYLDQEGNDPDPIEDDLALWVQTDGGVVVCFGCAHAGVINTLSYIRDLIGGAKIRAIIGGTHLVNAGRERLAETIAVLRVLRIPMIVPCHCTGEEASHVLVEALGEVVSPGASGMTFRF